MTSRVLAAAPCHVANSGVRWWRRSCQANHVSRDRLRDAAEGLERALATPVPPGPTGKTEGAESVEISGVIMMATVVVVVVMEWYCGGG